MTEPTVQELIAAGRRAEAEGDTARAARYRQAAQKATQAAQSKPNPKLDTFGNSAVDTYADFGRGVTNGAKNVVNTAANFADRMLEKTGAEGISTDWLDLSNAKRAARNDKMDEYRERSPIAMGTGEFVGEVAVTAPIGGLGGAAAKVGVNTVRTLAARKALSMEALKRTGKVAAVTGLAGEGATIGLLNADEGDNLALEGGKGAAIDLGLGGIINGVTRGGGRVVRSFMNRKGAVDEVAEKVGEVTATIDRAAQDGGYKLDAATATATRRGSQEMADLSADPSIRPSIDDHKARVEEDVATRAGEEVDKYSNGVATANFETAGRDVQTTLAGLRASAESGYKDTYKAFDELAAKTNTPLSVESVTIALRELNTANQGNAVKGVVDSVADDLNRYGIDVSDSWGKVRSKDGDILGVTTGNPRQATPNLTLENAENLVQDLNNYYNPTTPAANRYVAQVKEALTKHIDTTLEEMGSKAGVGSEVYTLGKQARDARRAFSDEWEVGDIFQKLTERTDGGEFAMDYTKSLSKINSTGNAANNILQVKSRLLTAENGEAAWKSMQQAPLLEAMEAALKDSSNSVAEGGVILFKHNAFESVINKAAPTREAKVALWGEEGAKSIEDMVSAWKLRNKTPPRSQTNPSGTAEQLIRQSRFLGSGGARNLGMALSGMFPVFKNAFGSGRRQESAKAILDGGKLPESMTDDMVNDLLYQWEDDFVGAGGEKYGNVLRTMLRAGTTNSTLEFIDGE